MLRPGLCSALTVTELAYNCRLRRNNIVLLRPVQCQLEKSKEVEARVREQEQSAQQETNRLRSERAVFANKAIRTEQRLQKVRLPYHSFTHQKLLQCVAMRVR